MQIYTWVSSILLLPGTVCWEYSSTTPKYFFQLVEISFEIAFFLVVFLAREGVLEGPSLEANCQSYNATQSELI